MKHFLITTIAAMQLVMGTVGYGAEVVPSSSHLRLNEILASNRAGRLDDDGQTSLGNLITGPSGLQTSRLHTMHG